MDVNTIASLITAVGFPIVACMGCALYVKYITDNYRQDARDMRREHSDEVSKMTEALANNTLAIQRLVDKLEQKGD